MPGPRPSRKIAFAVRLRAAHVRPLQSGKICRARQRDNISRGGIHASRDVSGSRTRPGRDKSLPYKYLEFFAEAFLQKGRTPR